MEDSIAMIISSFPYDYQYLQRCNQIAIRTTIAYDKYNCTKLFIMRCVLQINIAIIASTFHHDYQCSATIRLLNG